MRGFDAKRRWRVGQACDADSALLPHDELRLLADFTPTAGALLTLRARLRDEVRGVGFGNARFVRNVFEGAVVHQAWRLRDVATPSIEQLRGLESDDLAPIVVIECP